MQAEPPNGAPRRSRDTLIAIATTTVAVAIAAVVVVVTLHRAGELSRRSCCLVNLRAIGYAIQCYQRNRHAFPGPDPLGALIDARLIEANRTRCPDGGTYIVLTPTTFAGTDADPRQIVAYEPLSNHDEVVNVLYQDGHAQSVKAGAFKPPK